MRPRTTIFIAALALTLGCSSSGGQATPSAADLDNNAAAQALTAGIAFIGGVRHRGSLPSPTAKDITLVSADSSIDLLPGDPPSLMALGFDNPKESSDPVNGLMIQFAGGNSYVAVPRAGADAVGADAGTRGDRIEAHFSIDATVCNALCNKVYELTMFEAVERKAGGVSEHKSQPISLDCTKLGDPNLCEGATGHGAKADAGTAHVQTGNGGSTDGGTYPGGDSGAGGGGNPCGLRADAEPNDTRDTALAYTLGATITGCVGTAKDADFYEFSTPAADLAGGYVQIALSQVGDGLLQSYVYSASDNGEITNQYADSRGQNLNIWFAAAPGKKYRLNVTDFAGFDQAYRYTLQVTYMTINDQFEPNDTKSTAKPLALATPVAASLSAGFTGAKIADSSYQDWYSVMLSVGMVSIHLDNVPTDSYGQIHLIDAGGTELGHTYSANSGASAALDQSITSAGTYFVEIDNFIAPTAEAGKGMSVGDHLLHPYTLTVSQ